MIIVSDTSPLNYLVLVNVVHVLRELYGQVIVPPAVLKELDHPRTPGVVRQWAQQPPEWLKIQRPAVVDATLKLDPGEIEAIGLAKELRADHLLIDERQGTQVAKAEGLRPLSTLAVLAQAADAGHIDLPDVLHRLRTETSFRVTPNVIEHLLERDRERKRRGSRHK